MQLRKKRRRAYIFRQFFAERGRRMLHAPHIVAALMMLASAPAALAQKSTGHMELDDMRAVAGQHGLRTDLTVLQRVQCGREFGRGFAGCNLTKPSAIPGGRAIR